MNRLRNVFLRRRHVVLPVIHVESEAQALRNASLARQAKCDGVFLINHSIPVADLLEIHKQVVKEVPDWWVGINCLGVHPRQVFSMVGHDVAGVWTDNAYIDERTDLQPAADAILAARASASWEGLYFGGVAFKYQRAVEYLASAARLATQYMDVVTTSGPGTGQAASVAKIRSMKKALGDFPLAIASGITPENVADYLNVADCFLVASGISSSWGDLDPQRVRDFVQAVRSIRQTTPRPLRPGSDEPLFDPKGMVPNDSKLGIPSRFAAIFGSDHHSFPDALNRTRDLGLTDVLHFAGSGLDRPPCFHEKYSLSHIALKSIVAPLQAKNYNWETLAELDNRAARSPLCLPARVGDSCVVTVSGRPIFEMSAGELQLFRENLGQQLGIPAKEIRLVIVPDVEAGWCRYTENSLEVRREHSYRVPDPLRLEPSSTYFVSPGNCRAHLFCAFKGMARRIHWHSCS